MAKHTAMSKASEANLEHAPLAISSGLGSSVGRWLALGIGWFFVGLEFLIMFALRVPGDYSNRSGWPVAAKTALQAKLSGSKDFFRLASSSTGT